jgi:cell wall-associated NlpC family hydrolase
MEEITDSDKLSSEQILWIRKEIRDFAYKLLSIPYEFGAEWSEFDKIPSNLDCSELVEGCFNHFRLKMPDVSQNQFNFTIDAPKPNIGDLAFFGREGKTNKIYHVGLIYDETHIIEARAFDPYASFKTGEVILRPRIRWENYKNFCGYRSHPKLILHV